MYYFVLLYLLEGTFRKYVFASSSIILLKYFPLYISLYIHFFKNSTYFSYLLLGLPLWATLADPSQLPYAIYDFNATIIVPLVCLLVIPSITISTGVATGIIHLALWGGGANSGLIIVQALLGPTHWISQTVDQQFTQHVFSGLLQKAPGIAASSSPFITVAGLLALLALSLQGRVNRKFSLCYKSLVIFSVLFNLSSRFYSLGVFLYFIVEYALPLFSAKSSQRKAFLLILFAILVYFLYSIFLANFSDFFEFNRTFDDFGSAWGRLYSFFPVEQLFYSLPFIGGWGLGSTINNNPMYPMIILDTSSVPNQCLGFFREWEFTRLVCAFGFYAYLLIAARVAAALLLARRSFLSLLKTASALPEPLALFYVAINSLLAAQFKTNDIASGLLLISIVGRASSFSVIPKFSSPPK
jgi:hypothetical protein